MLIPAIKLFGSGLTKPIFAETKLIADMSPGEVRANFVFYIGAGAVASAGIIALLRALPTIIGAFRSGFQDLRGSLGDTATRLRTDLDLPVWVTLVGAVALALLLTTLPQLAVNLLGAVLIVVFGFFFVVVSSRITGEIGVSANPVSGHDHRRADRDDGDLPADRLDRRRPPGRRDLDRGRHRRGGEQRRRHQPGPQDRLPRRRDAAAAADRASSSAR